MHNSTRAPNNQPFLPCRTDTSRATRSSSQGTTAQSLWQRARNAALITDVLLLDDNVDLDLIKCAFKHGPDTCHDPWREAAAGHDYMSFVV